MIFKRLKKKHPSPSRSPQSAPERTPCHEKLLSALLLGVCLSASPISLSPVSWSSSSTQRLIIAAEAAPNAPTKDLASLRSQGLLYFKKKMMVQAREQFDLAYQTPKGPQDFIVVYYRGLLSYKQLKLETAFEMAELAVKIAEPESLDKRDAQKLLDELQGQFSYVEITTAKEETNKRGRVYLETKRRILNKQKREQFESIRTRFRSTDVAIPTKIYLPYGNYTANNVPFEIKKGSATPPSVSVFLHILKGEEGNKTWLYTGVGVAGTALLVGGYFLLRGGSSTQEVRALSFTPLDASQSSGAAK